MFRSDEILNTVDMIQKENLDVRAVTMGISLLDYMRGDDPTALIGLPLIALARMLRAEGVQVP